jgi:hypothetical protein
MPEIVGIASLLVALSSQLARPRRNSWRCRVDRTSRRLADRWSMIRSVRRGRGANNADDEGVDDEARTLRKTRAAPSLRFQRNRQSAASRFM